MIIKKHSILVFTLLSLLICLIFFSFFVFFYKGNSFCNDQTPYNQCSKLNPYYCSNGKLIEKASICGCEDYSGIKGDKCLVEYSSNPKLITLNYTLNRKEDFISLEVYEGIYNYLSNLSRQINLINGNLTRLSFKTKNLNQEYQMLALRPLVIEIQNRAKTKEDQARIAISLVQNIPFWESKKYTTFLNQKIPYQRMAYETVYEMGGVCGEKSELLVLLLREIGYGTSFIYYAKENHEAVGIKCPQEKGIANSSFCFIETTGPSILTDEQNDYLGGVKLSDNPSIIQISDGIALGEDLREYSDAITLREIREEMAKYGSITWFQYSKFNKIKERYGLVNSNKYSF